MAESRHNARTGRARLRGAAVPAALVGVSVLLVLVVVAVSSLMGSGGPGRIPVTIASPPGDQGQVLDGQTQSGGDPSADTVASRSASAKPSGPTKPDPPSPAIAFSPVSVEAESAALAGRAATSSGCAGCSGGMKVRFVGGTGSNTGRVTFAGLAVPAAATYHLTIGCELGDNQHGPFEVSVDGAAATAVTCAAGGWLTMSSTTVVVVLRAGANTITFGNPSANAPDLDKITISR